MHDMSMKTCASRPGLGRARLAVITALLLGCGDAGPADTENASNSGESGSDSDSGAASDSDDSSATPADAPTWHQDIAPLVTSACAGCHRDGGIAPFSMQSYELAAPWAAVMAAAVEAGDMPPWGAIETEECQPPHPFRHDPRLQPEEMELLRAWADTGAHEGDPETAAPLPQPPLLELEDPSVTLQSPSPIEVEGVEDIFYCFSLDPGLTEDVYVTGHQLIPGNPKVVHHALIYADTKANSAALAGPDGGYPCFGTAGVPATLLGAWVPGALPGETPEGIGIALPAGSRVILAFHYHPTGGGLEIDQSSVALRWTTEKPPYLGELTLVGNFVTQNQGLQPGPNDGGVPRFLIPAGAVDHTETMIYDVPQGVPALRVWAAGSHMHYIGTDMKTELVHQNGERECLLQTPRWDFEWQRVYEYDVGHDFVPRALGGDQVHIRCTYNNHAGNPHAVAALAEQGLSEPVDVKLGESSLEEMCLAVLGIAYWVP